PVTIVRNLAVHSLPSAGHFGGACANCKWRDHAPRCSVRDNAPAPLPPPPPPPSPPPSPAFGPFSPKPDEPAKPLVRSSLRPALDNNVADFLRSTLCHLDWLIQ